MRYIKQPDNYSCGPTAILNAMKWAGIDANGRDTLPYIQFGCRTIDLDGEDHGTLDHDFERVLKYVGQGAFTVERKKRPTVRMLQSRLDKGQGVALAYHWEEGSEKGDHYCFISGFIDGMFVCVNDHTAPNGPTITLRKPATVAKWLKKFGDCPTAWFLIPEN